MTGGCKKTFHHTIRKTLCASFGCIAILAPASFAHISDGQGKALQLYSAYTSVPPKINGSVTDKTNNAPLGSAGVEYDEWKNAFVRQVRLKTASGADSALATLYLMNDDNYLYVGITTNLSNSAVGNYLTLHFDQGIGGGNHDDLLQGGGAGINNAEYYAKVFPNNNTKEEGSYNGTTWIANTNAAVFSGSGSNLGSSFVQAEYKIPLNGNTINDNNSYLNVTNNQELGLYIEAFEQGGNKTYNWIETNRSKTRPDSLPGWADLRLGVKRSFLTFYSTFNANGNPIIDGNISGGTTPDDAWRGSYRRSITLTDFNGHTLPATLYSVEDVTNKNIYVGLKVVDPTNDAGDTCIVYQEQSYATSPSAVRNYILDAGKENALKATENAFVLANDQHWGATSWIADVAAGQTAMGKRFAAGNYEYEFQINRTGDAQDLNFSANSPMGFFIRYHDAKAGAVADYYWEYSPNSDGVILDNNGGIYSSIGWPELQLGAPYSQVIFPVDDATVEGVVNLRVFAQDNGLAGSGVDSIVSVKYFRASDTTTKIDLTRIARAGEWSGSWNVTNLANGSDTLIFRVTNIRGLALDRLVPLTIGNGSGSSSLPTVSLSTPTPGSTLSGTQTIAFTTTAGSGSITVTEISIDGAAYIATTTTTTHTWNTANLSEGNHTVQIRVTNTAGGQATSQVVSYLIQNGPTVVLTTPIAGSAVSGKVALTYTVTPKGIATIATDSLYVDGKANASLSLAGVDSVVTVAWIDGSHTFQIKSTDNNAKVGWSLLVTVLSKNAPSIRLLTTLADSTVSGQLALLFNASAMAPALVDSTFYALDGGNWRATNTDSTLILDTRALTEGAHQLQLQVRDSNRKTAFSTIVKFNIRNAPTVTINNPTPAALVNGLTTVRFKAKAVAPDVIVKNEIALAGGAWQVASDSTFNWDTRLFKDGAFTLQIRSTDGSGKNGLSSIVSMQIDNSAPKISMPSVRYPDNGSISKKGLPLVISALGLDYIAGLDKDSAMVLYTAKIATTPQTLIMHDDGLNGDLVAGDNVFSTTVNVNNDTSGAILYSLRGRDALGNDTTLQSFVVLDNIAPIAVFNLLPKPVRGADSVHGEVYSEKLVMKGNFSDSGGSGMAFVNLVVLNDSAAHVNNSPNGIPLDQGKFSRIINLVPGKNRILLVTGDRAGNIDTVSGEVTFIEPKVTVLVKPDSAATITSPDGSGVTIPAQSLYHPLEVTVRIVDPIEEPKPLDNQIKLLGVPHEYGPDKTIFRKPVTLTLSYTEADLDKNQDGIPDIDPKTLSIVFWDGSTWVKAGESSRDLINHRVTVTVNHFTLYDLASDIAPLPTKLKVYWNHNPIHQNQPAVFNYQLPAAGKVSLHILDLAGDMAREIIPLQTVKSAGTFSEEWDGQNVSGKFAGAGLYVYVFKYVSDDGKISQLIRKPLGLVKK